MNKTVRIKVVTAIFLCVSCCVLATQFVFGQQVPTGQSGATEPDDLLSKQLTTIEELANATDNTGKSVLDYSYRQSVIQSLTRIRQYTEARDFRNATQMCENMSSYPLSAPLRKAIKEFFASLARQMKVEQTRMVNDARSVLTNLSSLLPRTTTQDGLQTLSIQIKQFQSNLGRIQDSDNPDIQMIHNDLSQALDLVRVWKTYLAAETSGNLSKALESLNQIMSMSSYTVFIDEQEVNKKIERLQSSIGGQMSKIMESTRDELSKVTSSQEARNLSASFNRQCGRIRRSSYDGSSQEQDIESMRSTLNTWAQVLSAEEKGNNLSALQHLQNTGEYSWRGDSQVQDLINAKKVVLIGKVFDQPSGADDPLMKVVSNQVTAADSIDKLIDLKRRLTLFSYVGSRYSVAAQQSEVQSLVSDIQMLETWNAALQTKQFGQILQRQSPLISSNHRWKPTIDRYYNQVRGKVLAEMFELGQLEVSEGQATEQALLKAADKAVTAKEWEKVGRCLEAYRVVVFGNQTPPSYLTDQVNACRNFVTAQNLEKTGDIERAARTYLMVLNAPAQRSPVEEAIKELSRIRKTHPEISEKLRDTPASVPGVPASSSVPSNTR